MSQQRLAAANLARQQARENQMAAFGSLAGVGVEAMKIKGGFTNNNNTNTEEEYDQLDYGKDETLYNNPIMTPPESKDDE